MELQPMAGARRRDFLTGAAGAGMLLALGGCSSQPDVKPPPILRVAPFSPAEALLQDHGLLSRILLVYEESMRRLVDPGGDFHPLALVKAAQVMKDYIVGYHQDLEEARLYPRFLRSDTKVGLVDTLRLQHAEGRRLTETVLNLGGLKMRDDRETRRQLARVLGQVVRLYRPHEAREDTDLFPFLRNVVSAAEYDALGEDFEAERIRRFGPNAVERFVAQVSESEKALGIFELTDSVAG